MRNWIKSYWSNCLSIAAIICSVVAICVSLPSAPELGIDYIGVIVGILSLLVTMLIGWQIWNVIAIDKKIDSKITKVNTSLKVEIDVTKKDLIAYIQKESEQNNDEISVALLVLQADGLLMTSLYEDALFCYLSALSKAVDLEVLSKGSSLRVDYCLTKIKSALQLVDKAKMKAIGSKTIITYMKPLYKVEDHRAVDIIKFLNELI